VVEPDLVVGKRCRFAGFGFGGWVMGGEMDEVLLARLSLD
jgi:hypothetical protein